jgi:hypothetical protein
MSLNIKVDLAGILKQGFEEIGVSNILKIFTLNYSSYLFESEPQVSFQVDNGDVIPFLITDTRISVKSLIPKGKDGPVDIIARKKWLIAYPDNDSIKYITDGSFVGQYRIERNSLELKKITRNKASGKKRDQFFQV